MAIAQLAQHLNQNALLHVQGYDNALSVPVVIRDVKNAYGNTRFLVEPVGGSGSVWVADTRITFKA